MLSRFVTLLIGTLALAALRGQFDALAEPLASQPVGVKLWQMAGYFTILTNLAVVGLMFGVARGWRMPDGVAGGMVVSIAMVAIIYHLVLAHLRSLEGAAWWADQGLHTAVPLAVCLWWLVFAGKAVGWRDLPKWLIWPLVYGVYAMVRGAVTGFWPYPFVDADALGYAQVSLNIVGLVVAFSALGAALIGGTRLVR